ncbi:MAG: head-tail connector protein [Hyphomicrobiales bacterium]
MNMIPITGPSVEPITLAEMKLWLKVDGTEDDTVINALIVSARLAVEAVTKRALITQSWRVVLDAWRQGGLIRLPMGPLQAVTAARVYDAAGAATTVPVSNFLVDNSSRLPRVIVTGQVPTPGRVISGIEIDCTLGFGATGSTVPDPLRLAMRLLVTFWFENRGDVPISGAANWPESVLTLLTPYTTRRL